MFAVFVAFLLGVLTAVVGIAVVLYKVIVQTKEEALRSIQAKEERSRVPISVPPEGDRRTRKLVGWVAFATTSDVPDESAFKYCALQGNTLFQFENNKAERATGVLQLKGTTVALLPVGIEENKMFNKTFPVLLQCAARPLQVGGADKALYLFFKTSPDKEEWFLGLQRANLADDTVHMRFDDYDRARVETRFAALKSNISMDDGVVKASWLNALAARIFWNAFDRSATLAAVRAKIEKKLEGLKGKSKHLNGVDLRDVSLGPHLPEVQTAELLNLQDDGTVELNIEFIYRGGFQISLVPEIVVLGMTIPISMDFHIKRVEGKIFMRVPPWPAQRLWFGFYGQPHLEIDVKTQLGKSYHIQVPEIATIIENKIKEELMEVLSLPDMDDATLPLNRREATLIADLAREFEGREAGKTDVEDTSALPPEEVSLLEGSKSNRLDRSGSTSGASLRARTEPVAGEGEKHGFLAGVRSRISNARAELRDREPGESIFAAGKRILRRDKDDPTEAGAEADVTRL